MRRVVRWNRRSFRCCSRRCTLFATAEGDRCSSRAARAKLPCFAAAANATSRGTLESLIADRMSLVFGLSLLFLDG
jgi:hypothetical protein